jgi:circadian clock protein KaiC
MNISDRSDSDRLKTYVEGLDEQLMGGIKKGHVILLAGPPGAMKSSMALNMAYNTAKKENLKVLYVSVEESRESLLTSMRNLGMGDVSESKLLIVDLGRLRMEHPDADTGHDWFKILQEYLRKKVDTEGIRLVVIDSLTAIYALTMLENPRQELFHFFNFLKRLGVTTILISETHGNKGDFGTHNEDYLADGTILLRFVDVGETDVQLRLRIVKMRHTKIYHGDLTLLFRDGRFIVTTPITE